MKKALRNIKATFAESPMVWLSLVTAVWLFLRTVFYHSKLFPNLSSLMELTLVAFVGVVAAIVALLREREQ
ncbi:MAG TPA: hypothetical protein VID27_04595, partial [Blastocatellia bacterium]